MNNWRLVKNISQLIQLLQYWSENAKLKSHSIPCDVIYNSKEIETERVRERERIFLLFPKKELTILKIFSQVENGIFSL